MALALVLAAAPVRAQSVALDRLPHLHGLAVATSQPLSLLLAAHDGLYEATSAGGASRVSSIDHDFMSFAAHPEDRTRLYASGHPAEGGNLGLLVSSDGGATWRQLSQGAGGPVDFHALAVSAANPERLYGLYDGLQMSDDGGRSWAVAGALPGNVFDIAASGAHADTLYAAAREGLFVSRDAGRSWQEAFTMPKAATAVHVTASGRLYAFIYGFGLVQAQEPALKWNLVSAEYGNRAIMKLASDPAKPERLLALADTGAVLLSEDGGQSWTGLEGSHKAVAAILDKGRRIYRDSCQDCHGVDGVGERPDDIYAEDEYGYVAPPMDDSAHAWHHSDRNLVEVILAGSPRNQRMIAWRDVLALEEVESVVAYIKSLWSFRGHACQGARHMSCQH